MLYLNAVAIFDKKGEYLGPTVNWEVITEAQQKQADLRGKLDAIHKSQAVIEFDLDGHILTANENFLNTMGYRLEEVQGRHPRIFVEPEYASSSEYKDF